MLPRLNSDRQPVSNGFVKIVFLRMAEYVKKQITIFDKNY